MLKRVNSRVTIWLVLSISMFLISSIVIAEHHLRQRQKVPEKPSETSSAPTVKSQVDGQNEKELPSFGMTGGMFGPSLEQKENADFLLTPALLVQETIKSDVVITYPIE